MSHQPFVAAPPDFTTTILKYMVRIMEFWVSNRKYYVSTFLEVMKCKNAKRVLTAK